jgi:BirA family transcriptional regulator, biotin operon repressor / biotin---[acetyl-CoA-carboxylase] ligase
MTQRPRLSSFHRLLHVDEIDSTSDEAKRQAREGAAEGLVVWADRQTLGRGRRGRSWHSPSGNLYFSVLLRPNCRPAIAAQLSFAAALAVGEAIAALLPSRDAVRYKWPNDVLVFGRKVSGILLESQAGIDGLVEWLVIGIGVNIGSFPSETEYPATSLAAQGAYVPLPGALLETVALRFLDWRERWATEGFAPLREEWLGHAHGLGSEIRVRLDRSETAGRFVTLDLDGALILENASGRQHISAGALFPAP